MEDGPEGRAGSTAAFIPEHAEVMTIVIEYPPGDPGGPAFGYVLEGEMLFELEGEPSRRGCCILRSPGRGDRQSDLIRSPAPARRRQQGPVG
jgi:hypothetical protein